MQEKGQGIFWGEGSLIFILRVEQPPKFSQARIARDLLFFWLSGI